MFQVVNRSVIKKADLIGGGIVLVNIWAAWCDACLQMATLLPAITDLLNSDDKIVQIEWDMHGGLDRELKVFGVPTLLLYMDGHEIGRYSGTVALPELKRRIESVKRRGI